MFTHTFTAEVGERNCQGDISTLTIYISPCTKWSQLLWLEVREKAQKETVWETERHIRRIYNHTKLGEPIRRVKNTGILLPF